MAMQVSEVIAPKVKSDLTSTSVVLPLDLAIDDFSKKSLEGAALAFADADNPIRLNMFAVALRMVIEHFEKTLAPDTSVEKCAWFQQEPGRNGPTRKQRLKYCLQGGLSDQFINDEIGVDLDKPLQEFVRLYKALSEYVHGSEQRLIEDPKVQYQEACDLSARLTAFLQNYRDLRANLISSLEDKLDDAVVAAFLQETIMEVDELASHHSIKEIYVEGFNVVSIDEFWVHFQATGAVSVTLQFGSNSDMRRGDGAEIDEAFPFSVDFQTMIDDALDVSRAETTVAVDTSDWFDNYYQ